MMLSWKKLTAVFTVAFISFFFLCLPASVVLSWAGVGNIFKYRVAEGNLWHMQITGASVRGFYLGDIDYKPSFSVASGELAGAVSYQGAGRTATFDFELEQNKVIHLRNASIGVPVKVVDVPLPINGILSAQASDFSYDLSSGCVGGELYLRSNMLNPVFENTPWNVPLLEGTAVCDAGVLKANLVGENEVAQISVHVFWQGGPLVNATMQVVPTLGAEAQLEAMMQLAGLVKRGNAWQKQLTMQF